MYLVLGSINIERPLSPVPNESPSSQLVKCLHGKINSLWFCLDENIHDENILATTKKSVPKNMDDMKVLYGKETHSSFSHS